MSTRILLEALALAGDESERVTQLRKVVVALAVAGKLDVAGNALDLLASLGVQGKTVRVTSELPLETADSSRFVPLSAIAKIEKGKTGLKKAKPGPFPLVATAAERSSCDHYDFEGAAAIVPLVSSAGHGKASLNRLHYQEGRFALGSILAAIFPLDPQQISARFLYEYLSAFKNELLVTRMSGTANVTLTVTGLGEVPIPVVTLDAQAKVDELMALCDRLEEARAKREVTRDRLTTASLTRLNAPDPDPATFANHARFALNALPALTTRPDQIKQLRQTVLSLAVRGKLVPQDANDEPASELLKRILALPWTKKRKPSDLEPDNDALAQAFPLPRGWEWASVDALVRPDETVTYGILKPEWVVDGVPTVRVTEMKTGEIDVASLPKCDPARAAKFKKTTLAAGDLLVSKDGTIGKTAFVPLELAGGNITQHLLRFPICDLVKPQYVRLTIDAPFCQSWMAGETKGVALQGVNVGDFRRMPIPLPPLAEQHRIVAKVDDLMALCNQLEASLTASDDTRRRLLDALLAEALTTHERQDKAA